jgi:hypothetical protein
MPRQAGHERVYLHEAGFHTGIFPTGGVMTQQENQLDESIRDLLSELPQVREGQERRQNALTQDDGAVLSKMTKLIVEYVVTSQGCNLGLTIEQAIAIRNISEETLNELRHTTPETIKDMRDMVTERGRFLKAVGALVLAIITGVGGILAVQIQWRKLWHAIIGSAG